MSPIIIDYTCISQQNKKSSINSNSLHVYWVTSININIIVIWNSPLCVVFDSASANSVRDFLQWLLSSVVSIRSCLIISGLTSSSRLDEVSGDWEARRFGVDEAAPSTQRSPGAGNRGEAGGGVCTLLLPDDVFLPEMGADMLGRRVFIVDSGSAPPPPPSLSWSAAFVKHWPKFSLLHDATLCWMKRTMSERANGFWQAPHVRMSWWWLSLFKPSESADNKQIKMFFFWKYYNTSFIIKARYYYYYIDFCKQLQHHPTPRCYRVS